MTSVFAGALVTRALKAEGVTHVFGLLGHELLAIYDACLDEGIIVIGTRHETAAANMADAYARLTGRPGVFMVAAGPGHANAILGLATASFADSPVIGISAHSELGGRDRLALQELDQVGLVKPITKWARLVTQPERIPEYLSAAFRHALAGRPGPVHLSLPGDLIDSRVDELEVRFPPPNESRSQGRPHADPRLIERALDLLASAERPAAMAGTGAYWGGRPDALRQLIELVGLPLFTIELARGLVPDDHPLCFGYGEVQLNPPAQLLSEADVVLLLGKTLDWRVTYGGPPTFGPDTKFIMIEQEPTEIGRNQAVSVGIAADVGAATEQLLAAARDRRWVNRTSWLSRLEDLRRTRDAEYEKLGVSDEVPIHPARVAREVRAALRRDAVIAGDGGDFGHWVRMCLPVLGPGRWLHHFPLGGLGAALPFALGARAVIPDAQVLALAGDGAFGFSAMEFDTAVRHDLPVVCVVGNDAAWGIEKHVQQRIYGADRLVGSTLAPTRYDRLVEALGGAGFNVERPEDLRPALGQALACGRPACINVAVASLDSPMTDNLIRRKRRAAGEPEAAYAATGRRGDTATGSYGC
jgi:acetolactate synthase I/II/III large subunit